MPSIKITNQATSANALNGLKFAKLVGAALISLYVSGVTATDVVSFSVESEEYLRNANPNIEVSADVVDTDRDQVLFREPVIPGDMFLACTVTTAINFLLVIENIPT